MYVNGAQTAAKHGGLPVHPLPADNPGPEKHTAAYVWFWIAIAVATLVMILIAVKIWLNSRAPHEKGCICRTCPTRPQKQFEMEPMSDTDLGKLAEKSRPPSVLPVIDEEETADLLSPADSDTKVQPVVRPIRFAFDETEPKTPTEPEPAESLTRRKSLPSSLKNMTMHLGFDAFLPKNTKN